MAIAALILGIVGLCGWGLGAVHEALCVIPIASTLLALIFGIARRREPFGKAGMILGIMGIVIPPLLVFYLLFSEPVTTMDSTGPTEVLPEPAPNSPAEG